MLKNTKNMTSKWGFVRSADFLPYAILRMLGIFLANPAWLWDFVKRDWGRSGPIGQRDHLYNYNTNYTSCDGQIMSNDYMWQFFKQIQSKGHILHNVCSLKKRWKSLVFTNNAKVCSLQIWHRIGIFFEQTVNLHVLKISNLLDEDIW